MSDSNDTAREKARKAEDLRARALRRWNKRVWAAYLEYEKDVAALLQEAEFADLRFTDIPVDEEERTARSITFRVAALVIGSLETANGREYLAISDEDADTLKAVKNRLHSAVYADERAGVAQAASIVREHVEGCRYLLTGEVPEGDDPFVLRGKTPEEVVQSLVLTLANIVHPNFGRLQTRRDDVAALLARYEPDRHRRRRAKPALGGLGLDGILSELNEMCDRPLGAGGKLSASAIGNRRRASENA